MQYMKEQEKFNKELNIISNMVDVIEITIKEFKDSIYKNYINLFPKEEQRKWVKIEKTYQKGIERIYKITLDNSEIIGFFMLEKIDDYPFYLDYFAIYKEYQNKGYGTCAIKRLIDKIIKNDELICEIEAVEDKNPITVKRFEFYNRIGFKKIMSEYLLYNVCYTPIIYSKNKEVNKEQIDKVFFKYYKINCGEKEVNKNCKLLR